jgi:hypothetical protein
VNQDIVPGRGDVSILSPEAFPGCLGLFREGWRGTTRCQGSSSLQLTAPRAVLLEVKRVSPTVGADDPGALEGWRARGLEG